MDDWNTIIASLPNPHLLQTWEWGQFKAQYGWQPLPQVWRDENGNVNGAALVLQRTQSLAGGAVRLRVLYVPKGPLLDWSNAALRKRVLDDLCALARKQGAIFIKIDADVCLGSGAVFSGETTAEQAEEEVVEDALGQQITAELEQDGWLFSGEQIQFRNTVLVDLTPTEEEMLGRMKQKTRYNVRLAGRKGVSVRRGGVEDLPLLYRMYAETSLRDGFVIREEAYYTKMWQTFIQAGMATPLIAEVREAESAPAENTGAENSPTQPVAAIMLFHFGGRAWYIHGMSRNLHREKMPNHLLQWEAMRYAKSLGCTWYDLWGAPDFFHEQDSMWGVYLFKRGLGGVVWRSMGAWDFPVNSLLYRVYTRLLPRILDVMRRRGTAKTQQMIT